MNVEVTPAQFSPNLFAALQHHPRRALLLGNGAVAASSPPPAVAGDSGAAERLAAALRDPAQRRLLHRQVQRYVGVEDAEDVVQEVLVRAWRALPRFRGDCAPSSWLFRIGFNVAMNWVQRQRRWEERETGFEEVEWRFVEEREAEPEEAVVGAEQALRLERALAALPKRIREVVEQAVAGESYEAIARRQGVPIGTVRSRLFRGRVVLRRVLEAADADDADAGN